MIINVLKTQLILVVALMMVALTVALTVALMVALMVAVGHLVERVSMIPIQVKLVS